MANEVRITEAGTSKQERNEYCDKHIDALAVIFRTDPAIRFGMCNLSREEHNAFLHTYMGALQRGALYNNGVFQEADDWQCCAVWMPPGERIDNPLTLFQSGLAQVSLKLGLGAIKRMIWDFQATMDSLKKKHLKKEGIKRYWYLWFIGTHEASRGKGLASKVIKNFQETVAKKENLPIWLESTTETSRRVYEKCGFKIMDEVVLGKGTNAANGDLEKGGPGVRLWAMLWKPEDAA